MNDLPPQLAGQSKHLSSPIDMIFPPEGIDFDDLQRSVIQKALERAGGNKTRAARLLGMTRRKLYSRMESLGLKTENGEE